MMNYSDAFDEIDHNVAFSRTDFVLWLADNEDDCKRTSVSTIKGTEYEVSKWTYRGRRS